MAKGEGGVDIGLSKSFSNTSYLRPQVELSFLAVFEDSYEEKEESSTILSVENSCSSFLRSKIAFEIRKEFFKSTFGYWIPSLTTGWILMQPLSHSSYQVKPACEKSMDKDYRSSSHLLLGLKLTAVHKRAIRFALGFEAQLLGKYQMQIGRFILEWDW